MGPIAQADFLGLSHEPVGTCCPSSKEKTSEVSLLSGRSMVHEASCVRGKSELNLVRNWWSVRLWFPLTPVALWERLARSARSLSMPAIEKAARVEDWLASMRRARARASCWPSGSSKACRGTGTQKQRLLNPTQNRASNESHARNKHLISPTEPSIQRVPRSQQKATTIQPGTRFRQNLYASLVQTSTKQAGPTISH